MPDINYQYGFYIDITPTGGSNTWAEIGAGILDYKKTMNEVVQAVQYLCDKGWGSTEVTGAQLQTSFTGNRVRGDAAQDYIFGVGVQYSFGSSRHSNYKLVAPDGSTITGKCTLAKIDDTGGKSTEQTAISFEVHFNGMPTFTGALGALTVVSVAGTGAAGTTQIYVNPAKAAGNSYKYAMAAVETLPAEGAILTTGWNTWDGAAAITGAVTGQQIVVAEVTSANAAVKAGIATVTAHA